VLPSRKRIGASPINHIQGPLPQSNSPRRVNDFFRPNPLASTFAGAPLFASMPAHPFFLLYSPYGCDASFLWRRPAAGWRCSFRTRTFSFPGARLFLFFLVSPFVHPPKPLDNGIRFLGAANIRRLLSATFFRQTKLNASSPSESPSGVFPSSSP